MMAATTSITGVILMQRSIETNLSAQPVIDDGDMLLRPPFVMDTPERLAQAKRDYASGAMGRLEGVPF